MTTERNPPDRDHAIELYRSGLSLSATAKTVGRSMSTVQSWLERAGVMRSRADAQAAYITSLRSSYAADAVRLFDAGQSVKAIAAALGRERSVIANALRSAGREPRNRSEAMRQRMAQTTPEERQALARAANAARRSSAASATELASKALRKARTLSKIGVGERELAGMLEERGVTAQLQHAVGPYNVDLLCGSVAVEVHSQARQPHTLAATRKRIKYLLDQGLAVLYVRCASSGGVVPPSARAADEIVAFVQLAERDPAARRQYRVIRRTGEVLPFTREDLN